MRKLLRSVARARMQREGLVHINKEGWGVTGEKVASHFARNWRKYAAKACAGSK